MLEAVALPIVKYALSEDVGTGDITTLNAVPVGINARAAIVAKEPGVIGGTRGRAADVSRGGAGAQVPRARRATAIAVAPGAAVAQVLGDVGSILKAERTALNFLQHLSGIATLDAPLRRRGRGHRRGDPRHAQDHARTALSREVRGHRPAAAQNHRLALWDMYLVKDNHIRAAGGITAAVDRIARTRQGDLLLEVEVESLDQLREALRPEVDRILVDNRTPEEVRRAVEEVDRVVLASIRPTARAGAQGARRWPEIEVSGGITLGHRARVRETGADYFSVGALTHCAAGAQPEPGDRRSWLRPPSIAMRSPARSRRAGLAARWSRGPASSPRTTSRGMRLPKACRTAPR